MLLWYCAFTIRFKCFETVSKASSHSPQVRLKTEVLAAAAIPHCNSCSRRYDDDGDLGVENARENMDWTTNFRTSLRNFLNILGLGILSLKLQPSFMTCWPVGSLLSLPISSLEIDPLWISHSSGCSCPSNWEILGDIGSVVFLFR